MSVRGARTAARRRGGPRAAGSTRRVSRGAARVAAARDRVGTCASRAGSARPAGGGHEKPLAARRRSRLGWRAWALDCPPPSAILVAAGKRSGR